MRIFASFAVIVIHVAAQNWRDVDVNSFEWQAMNFWDSVVRWAVPVFVMMSGALFLKKDIPLKKIYSKYIFRIFTAFLFWSFVYAVRFYIKSGNLLISSARFIRGPFHLWFLFMISGLYMIVPFVKKVAASEFLTKYFLVLSFVFAFTLPQCVKIITLFSEKYGMFAEKFVDGFSLYFVVGFTGYFLLGYFLNNMNISKKLELIIYIAGILGFVMTIVMSSCVSIYTGKANETFYGNMTINVLCESIAVFVFVRKNFTREIKSFRILSQYSFGAYLVHIAVIGVIKKIMDLNTLSFNPAFSVPVISVMVFVLSFIISAVLNKIPLLKKHIV